ncbi:hypothetical protein BpHYR1_035115 [Brachionus plicatilis]|uniref:Uncharacterized protein n=1 Tax=Brachionus plicatilis TaxID=10195 RepID=A0A3M7RJU2_BRAPC|nr:hypothetical protein BpHYR1_035115 [Brachionus plicatilis]
MDLYDNLFYLSFFLMTKCTANQQDSILLANNLTWHGSLLKPEEGHLVETRRDNLIFIRNKKSTDYFFNYQDCVGFTNIYYIIIFYSNNNLIPIIKNVLDVEELFLLDIIND